MGATGLVTLFKPGSVPHWGVETSTGAEYQHAWSMHLHWLAVKVMPNKIMSLKKERLYRKSYTDSIKKEGLFSLYFFDNHFQLSKESNVTITIHHKSWLTRSHTVSLSKAHMDMILFECFLKSITWFHNSRYYNGTIYIIDNVIVLSDLVKLSRYSSKTLQKGSCPYAPLDKVLQ